MTKNLILGGLCCLFSAATTAQVGINTTDPQAQLDISVENPDSPEPEDGVLIPRINNFPATQPSAEQHGILVFLTTQKGDFEPGFYFWNNKNKIWEPLTNKISSDFHKTGTTTAAGNINDPIFRKGNVSIGGEAQNVKLKVMIAPDEPITTKTGIEVENASSAPTTVTYGILSSNKSITADKKYGIKNSVSADGQGIHYGIFNETNQKHNEEIYGIYNDVGKTFGATKNHYGIYNRIGTPQGTGMVYGIYSTAAGNDPKKVFAGYFAGRVGIGATPLQEYILPDVRGVVDQVLTMDANGLVAWKHQNHGTYTSTTSATGSYIIPEETMFLRINNEVSSITIPDAAANKGRFLYLVNWSGNSYKPFVFLGTNDLFDVSTNSSVTGIAPGQTLQIVSAGNRWILLDK